jgi:hypothetical protein
MAARHVVFTGRKGAKSGAPARRRMVFIVRELLPRTNRLATERREE